MTANMYEPGDIVWVKLSNSWWPGEVWDQNKVPDDLSALKKKPIAVVKFFNEDSYEYVKNTSSIFDYNCHRKNDFIKKGLDLKRSSNNSFSDKFREDVVTAEKLTGGDILILEKYELEKQSSASRRSNIVKMIFGGNTSPNNKKTQQTKTIPKSNAFEKSPKIISNLKGRSIVTVKNIIKHLPEKINNGNELPQKQNQTNTNSSSSSPSNGNYKCHMCSFTSMRQNVIILHSKTHLGQQGSNSSITQTSSSRLQTENNRLSGPSANIAKETPVIVIDDDSDSELSRTHTPQTLITTVDTSSESQIDVSLSPQQSITSLSSENKSAVKKGDQKTNHTKSEKKGKSRGNKGIKNCLTNKIIKEGNTILLEPNETIKPKEVHITLIKPPKKQFRKGILKDIFEDWSDDESTSHLIKSSKNIENLNTATDSEKGNTDISVGALGCSRLEESDVEVLKNLQYAERDDKIKSPLTTQKIRNIPKKDRQRSIVLEDYSHSSSNITTNPNAIIKNSDLTAVSIEPIIVIQQSICTETQVIEDENNASSEHENYLEIPQEINTKTVQSENKNFTADRLESVTPDNSLNESEQIDITNKTLESITELGKQHSTIASEKQIEEPENNEGDLQLDNSFENASTPNKNLVTSLVLEKSTESDQIESPEFEPIGEYTVSTIDNNSEVKEFDESDGKKENQSETQNEIENDSNLDITAKNSSSVVTPIQTLNIDLNANKILKNEKISEESSFKIISQNIDNSDIQQDEKNQSESKEKKEEEINVSHYEQILDGTVNENDKQQKDDLSTINLIEKDILEDSIEETSIGPASDMHKPIGRSTRRSLINSTKSSVKKIRKSTRKSDNIYKILGTELTISSTFNNVESKQFPNSAANCSDNLIINKEKNVLEQSDSLNSSTVPKITIQLYKKEINTLVNLEKEINIEEKKLVQMEKSENSEIDVNNDLKLSPTNQNRHEKAETSQKIVSEKVIEFKEKELETTPSDIDNSLGVEAISNDISTQEKLIGRTLRERKIRKEYAEIDDDVLLDEDKMKYERDLDKEKNLRDDLKHTKTKETEEFVCSQKFPNKSKKYASKQDLPTAKVLISEMKTSDLVESKDGIPKLIIKSSKETGKEGTHKVMAVSNSKNIPEEKIDKNKGIPDNNTRKYIENKNLKSSKKPPKKSYSKHKHYDSKLFKKGSIEQSTTDKIYKEDTLSAVFDFQEEDDTELVLTSLSKLKKKFMSPDKTKEQDLLQFVNSDKQKEVEHEDEKLKADIENLLNYTKVPDIVVKNNEIDVMTATDNLQSVSLSEEVKTLPIKERGKRFFKSRNISRNEDVQQIQSSSTIVATVSGEKIMDTATEDKRANNEVSYSSALIKNIVGSEIDTFTNKYSGSLTSKNNCDQIIEFENCKQNIEIEIDEESKPNLISNLSDTTKKTHVKYKELIECKFVNTPNVDFSTLEAEKKFDTNCLNLENYTSPLVAENSKTLDESNTRANSDNNDKNESTTTDLCKSIEFQKLQITSESSGEVRISKPVSSISDNMYLIVNNNEINLKEEKIMLSKESEKSLKETDSNSSRNVITRCRRSHLKITPRKRSLHDERSKTENKREETESKIARFDNENITDERSKTENKREETESKIARFDNENIADDLEKEQKSEIENDKDILLQSTNLTTKKIEENSGQSSETDNIMTKPNDIKNQSEEIINEQKEEENATVKMDRTKICLEPKEEVFSTKELTNDQTENKINNINEGLKIKQNKMENVVDNATKFDKPSKEINEKSITEQYEENFVQKYMKDAGLLIPFSPNSQSKIDDLSKLDQFNDNKNISESSIIQESESKIGATTPTEEKSSKVIFDKTNEIKDFQLRNSSNESLTLANTNKMPLLEQAKAIVSKVNTSKVLSDIRSFRPNRKRDNRNSSEVISSDSTQPVDNLMTVSTLLQNVVEGEISDNENLKKDEDFQNEESHITKECENNKLDINKGDYSTAQSSSSGNTILSMEVNNSIEKNNLSTIDSNENPNEHSIHEKKQESHDIETTPLLKQKRKISIENDISNFVIEKSISNITSPCCKDISENEAVIDQIDQNDKNERETCNNKIKQKLVTKTSEQEILITGINDIIPGDSSSNLFEIGTKDISPEKQFALSNSLSTTNTETSEENVFDISNLPILLTTNDEILPENIQFVITQSPVLQDESAEREVIQSNSLQQTPVEQIILPTPKKIRGRPRKSDPSLSTNPSLSRLDESSNELNQQTEDISTTLLQCPSLENSSQTYNVKPTSSRELGVDSSGNSIVLIQYGRNNQKLMKMPKSSVEKLPPSNITDNKSYIKEQTTSEKNQKQVQQNQLQKQKQKNQMPTVQTKNIGHHGNGLNSQTKEVQKKSSCESQQGNKYLNTGNKTKNSNEVIITPMFETTTSSHKPSQQMPKLQQQSTQNSKSKKSNFQRTTYVGTENSEAIIRQIQQQQHKQEQQKHVTHSQTNTTTHRGRKRKDVEQPIVSTNQNLNNPHIQRNKQQKLYQSKSQQSSQTLQKQMASSSSTVTYDEPKTELLTQIDLTSSAIHQPPPVQQSSAQQQQQQLIHQQQQHLQTQQQKKQSIIEEEIAANKIMAVPANHFGIPGSAYYLCSQDNEGNYMPIDNQELYLDPESNQLVPLSVLNAKTSTVIETSVSQNSSGLTDSNLNIIESNRTSVCMEIADSNREHNESAGSNAIGTTNCNVTSTNNISNAEVGQQFIQTNNLTAAELSSILSPDQSICINIDGQQLILDQQSFLALVAAGGENTQLETQDGQILQLTSEFLAALGIGVSNTENVASGDGVENSSGAGEQQIILQTNNEEIVTNTAILSSAIIDDVLHIETSQGMQIVSAVNASIVAEETIGHAFQTLTPPVTAQTNETNALLTQPPIMSTLEVPSNKNKQTSKQIDNDTILINTVSGSSVNNGINNNNNIERILPTPQNLEDCIAFIGVSTQSSTVPSSLELPITVTNPAIAPPKTTAAALGGIYNTKNIIVDSSQISPQMVSSISSDPELQLELFTTSSTSSSSIGNSNNVQKCSNNVENVTCNIELEKFNDNSKQDVESGLSDFNNQSTIGSLSFEDPNR